jgi:hypothetical protein
VELLEKVSSLEVVFGVQCGIEVVGNTVLVEWSLSREWVNDSTRHWGIGFLDPVNVSFHECIDRCALKRPLVGKGELPMHFHESSSSSGIGSSPIGIALDFMASKELNPSFK